MTKQKIVEILRELRFSSGLSEAEMEQLAAIAVVVDFPAGTTIFTEGSANHDLYLLRSGRVQLSMNVPPRGLLPILTLGDGDLLGWSQALLQGQMTTTAIAITRTEALRVDTNRLQALCDHDHDIGYEIMRRIAVSLLKRLVATRLQVLDLFSDKPSGFQPGLREAGE